MGAPPFRLVLGIIPQFFREFHREFAAVRRAVDRGEGDQYNNGQQNGGNAIRFPEKRRNPRQKWAAVERI